MARKRISGVALFVLASLLAGCAGGGGGETGSLQNQTSESCMLCHNGSLDNDYAGPGIENPHPFGTDVTQTKMLCTKCHGGNGNGTDKLTSHVPPPPQIGDANFQINNAKAYFNRLTLAGMDKFPDYTVDGTTYTALDYLQFVNPGDLRVTKLGRSCGECHANHAEDVDASLLNTEAGIFSGASYAIGTDNQVPENQGLGDGTAADLAFRACDDADFQSGSAGIGDVPRVIETPVYALNGGGGPNQVFNNPAYLASALLDDINPDHTVVQGSPLHNLFIEQVSFTCGDCHLGSAGQNNRAGDFRSSGCSACHMRHSLDGKSKSKDPNISKVEPVDPDAINEPELSHTVSHRIASIKKTMPNGAQVKGIDDQTCAGCHQGSNRTVMQYWGIRLDQNADVVNNRQYPANPFTRTTTHNDQRLFPDASNNDTFNGRNGNQYLLKEDYDGDGRDDTPADVHYDAGLGCIDCHGSFDMHGGDTSTPGTEISSHMEQQVAIHCENCHGTVDTYAATQTGTSWDGSTRELALDTQGHVLDHVYKASNGNYYLRSRLTGVVHYVKQTRDVVVNSGKVHPTTMQPVYNVKASFAMGRYDADPLNGIGPVQTGAVTSGFSHGDNMECATCHSSWTNTCMGCHLSGEYNTGNNFSNITGERIVFKQRTADFTYQSPLFFQLGVGPRGKITQFAANTKVFFAWQDQQGTLSRVFHFADRNGGSTNPPSGFPALNHNSFFAHSIRGKVTASNEGPRYCVACHLTTEALANYGTQYNAFRTAIATGNYGALDYNLLKQHFGRNTGNQMDSPFFAHMAAGLGTGLFTFDDEGAPVNPLDNFAGRKGAQNIAPASIYDPARIALDLDRVVETSGAANGSNEHPWLNLPQGPNLRDGALDPQLAGPLGATLIQKLADPVNGIVLDSWLDANGACQGDAQSHLGVP